MEKKYVIKMVIIAIVGFFLGVQLFNHFNPWVGIATSVGVLIYVLNSVYNKFKKLLK